MRGRWYTLRWLEQQASLTLWSKTLPVTVGGSHDLQQACVRLHKTFLAHKKTFMPTRNAAARKYLYIVNDSGCIRMHWRQTEPRN